MSPAADPAPHVRAPYIREQFRAAHRIAHDAAPHVVLNRIVTDTSGDCVDPDRLTVVTKTSLCELAGIQGNTFNAWKENDRGAGRPPEGRWFGDRGKPGSPIMWYFERDIIPWLSRTHIGEAALHRMIAEIQAGQLYPIFTRTGTGGRNKRLEGYATSPRPERWPRVGRRKAAV